MSKQYSETIGDLARLTAALGANATELPHLEGVRGRLRRPLPLPPPLPPTPICSLCGSGGARRRRAPFFVSNRAAELHSARLGKLLQDAAGFSRAR
jgi:hypothetical protein